MNKQDFTYLLAHPEQLTTDQIASVGDIVAHYPYFQPARALHLKGLKAKQSFKYNQELRVTAAYTTDRSILFDFITSEAFNQNEISKLIKQNTEVIKDLEVEDVDDISVNKSVFIDDALKQHIKDSEGILDPELFEKKVSVKNLIDEEATPILVDLDVKSSDPTPEEQLNIGKPLDFHTNESRSFTEWLNITNFKPIQRPIVEPVIKQEAHTATQTKSQNQNFKLESALEKKLDIIDKFISSYPKISPIKQVAPSINLAQTKLVQNDSLMTETLARIYLEQKNYDKAIQSYRILILKYPEKSSFFADQIKAVKQLQANNTK